MEPFRPHLARVSAFALIALVTLATAALVVLMPDLTALDRTGFVLLGALVVWFCWRQASVAALPDEDGLTVRNLLVTTRVSWAQIVSVRFGDRPWVQLDLADGDTLAVMGVQRADGERAQVQARRLATLHAERTRTPTDD
ncbi:PH domain-containing protein [Cellulomonas gilvus]|uniref:Low molecular weight protein antigen 6 PH domain-containing protein n=1 Tax=Cellulomonas gilvus (strain ATCC 13127 / NRRL B-14078) TaxID=593907 RepID=F8A6B2_CELGA|nr:PH domain-containing protein [Cellulomonas gilvus]AEI12268.1 protein of unknown function DUF2581 [Cellulomonas gilvus ATCC 13127]